MALPSAPTDVPDTTPAPKRAPDFVLDEQCKGFIDVSIKLREDAIKILTSMLEELKSTRHDISPDDWSDADEALQRLEVAAENGTKVADYLEKLDPTLTTYVDAITDVETKIRAQRNEHHRKMQKTE